ncbi:unnamed protein product [Mytilus edulis]|uniref:C2H2-type domain-containing protein n=1 Tax=Mytilus edulis TaxID=6550 RepID=A0A8S3R1J0_MYTED|nr:unnamed protein product [Mytilus edulis]
MGDEIEEVRKACIDIITNVFGTPNAPSNYILVTFNDPVKHMHRLTTSNGLEMISALGNLTVEGGDDCPEYAMSGLEKAIELCQEQSTIFFYTDAPAKDEAERDTVINAAEEKHIDLQLFVHNETCGPLRKRRATERTKRDVESHVYSQVAEGTGGAIYRFNTSLLGELMIQISEEYENENLVCHIKEHHAGLESYDCTEDNCSSTFIRRGNLLKYLITIHGVEQKLARYKLLSAERMKNSINKQYYDDVSENNIILGLIND